MKIVIAGDGFTRTHSDFGILTKYGLQYILLATYLFPALEEA